MLARLPPARYASASGSGSPVLLLAAASTSPGSTAASARDGSNKPYLLLVFLSACAVALVIVEAIAIQTEPLLVLLEDETQDDSYVEVEGLREDSFAGLVFSTDKLTYGSNGDSYWFCLTKQPEYNVTVTIEDPSKCTTTTRSLHITFTAQDWFRPRRVRAQFSALQGVCTQGLVHACLSQDLAYDGLHVRLWVNTPADLTNTNEKIGEWVPEEVLEEEEEGPQTALAPLERSRMSFNFQTEGSMYRCLPIEPDKLQCVLGFGTQFETPFFVVDPKHGVDDDGWNGFPVILVVGGSHGNEAAGAAAAVHVARFFRPRRGRLIVIPYANILGLREGVRTIAAVTPNGHRLHSDLNRNFPLDNASEPQGELAQMLWALVSKLRPDILLDFHEGWGFYGKTKSNPHSRLVGSKTFSKGSSIICSEDAKLIAQSIANRLNEDTNLPPERKFEVITPPIEGGLARKMNAAFSTRAILTETTKLDQALSLRVSQHLRLAAATLIAVNVLGGDFDQSGFASTHCLQVVTYGRNFSNSPCFPEKDGVVLFPKDFS